MELVRVDRLVTVEILCELELIVLDVLSVLDSVLTDELLNVLDVDSVD